MERAAARCRSAGARARRGGLSASDDAVRRKQRAKKDKSILAALEPTAFVPGVGLLRQPDAEMRHTNNIDFWTSARSNSMGFTAAEPPDPERAAASCHIAVIGDSYVEALQVPNDAKLQIRLEEIAEQELPELDVTTSAFGRGGTGQVNQFAFYDGYARALRPNVVALVFVVNDVADNHPALSGLQWGVELLRAPQRPRAPLRGDLSLLGKGAAHAHPRLRRPRLTCPAAPPTIAECGSASQKSPRC